jgi:phage I-like protein
MTTAAAPVVKPIRVFTGELNPESVVRTDGTMWSHAATLGTRVKGTSFTIDRATVDNFIRVFTSGYPQKVPVDYDHGTVNGASDGKQPVPKAGDVLEMKGIYAASDFTGDLLEAATKLAEKVSRPLDDDRNFGLWIRWRPTARALRMITDREYSEMSIAFDGDLAHNVTGAPQGPTIISIALTNLPFLDDMLPVAASRAGGSPAEPGSEETKKMSKFLNTLSALFGKPAATEEEAEAMVTAAVAERNAEITQLRQHKAFSDVISAEIGETDPAKAATKIRELKQQAATAQTESESAKKTANETARDAILAKHEKKLTVPLKTYFGAQLMAELSAGKKSGETETEKALTALPEQTALTRTSSTDTGKDAPTDRDSLINERALSLMAERQDLIKMAEKDEAKAFKQALRIASSEIPRTVTDRK